MARVPAPTRAPRPARADPQPLPAAGHRRARAGLRPERGETRPPQAVGLRPGRAGPLPTQAEVWLARVGSQWVPAATRPVWAEPRRARVEAQPWQGETPPGRVETRPQAELRPVQVGPRRDQAARLAERAVALRAQVEPPLLQAEPRAAPAEQGLEAPPERRQDGQHLWRAVPRARGPQRR
jgi:hypothetical protein